MFAFNQFLDKMTSLVAKTSLEIAKPAHEVYNAIVDDKLMSKYFITSASGPMVEGETVTWNFEDHGSQFDVQVLALERDSRIAFSWPCTGKVTHVEIVLKPIADGSRTFIGVTESDWPVTVEGAKLMSGQVAGWMHMFLCIKGLLEFNVHLRDPSTCTTDF